MCFGIYTKLDAIFKLCVYYLDVYLETSLTLVAAAWHLDQGISHSGNCIILIFKRTIFKRYKY